MGVRLHKRKSVPFGCIPSVIGSPVRSPARRQQLSAALKDTTFAFHPEGQKRLPDPGKGQMQGSENQRLPVGSFWLEDDLVGAPSNRHSRKHKHTHTLTKANTHQNNRGRERVGLGLPCAGEGLAGQRGPQRREMLRSLCKRAVFFGCSGPIYCLHAYAEASASLRRCKGCLREHKSASRCLRGRRQMSLAALAGKSQLFSTRAVLAAPDLRKLLQYNGEPASVQGSGC